MALLGALACAARQRLPEASLLAAAPVVREKAKDPGPAHVLLAKWHYELHADGTFRNTFTHKYKILDQRGVETWAYTGSDWTSWYLDKPVITATVTSPGGGVSQLDPKTLAQAPAHPDAPHEYGDGLVLRAPLPNVAIGSIVDETIVTASHRAFFDGGMTRSFVFQSQVARDHVELVIDSPKDMPIEIQIRDAKVKRTEELRGDIRRIVFQGGPYEALEEAEDLLPPESSGWPQVAFSTGRSWQTVARAYSAVVERQLEGIDFAATVRKIVQPTDATALEKARRIHAWLKDRIRYTAISFGDSSIIPRSPVNTMGSGYGDCKDQATLLVGLLRAAGVRAHVALLNAGFGADIDPKLPSLDVFNHAIVLADSEPPLWIDPTADLVRVGSLPADSQNRLSLIADSSTSALVRTPVPTSKTSTYVERRIVRLAEEGPASVKEVSTATGWHEWQLRDQAAAPEAKHRETLTDYVKRNYNASELGEIVRKNPRDLSTAYEFSLEAKKAMVGWTDPFEASVAMGTSLLFGWLPDALVGQKDTPRKNALQLPVPYQASVIWELHPPDGYLPSGVPNETVTQLGPARLAVAVRRLAGGAIEVQESIDVPPRFTAAEVETFRAAYKKWTADPGASASFKHRVRTAIDGDDLSAAAKELRRDIDLHPKSGLPHVRRGLALSELGFGEEGRKEAREAMALSPDDALVQREAGHLLSRGDRGAEFGPGFERSAAIEAYKKAAALDETDIYSRLRMGVLLEYNDKGDRYANPQLATACAHYDSLDAKRVREFDNGSFSANPLFCLLEAGKLDELARRIEAMPIATVPAGPAVMAAALRGGAAAALKEVARLGLSSEDRASALSSAAGKLFRAREYAGAVELLEKSASKGEDSVKVMAMVRAWRKIKKVDPRTILPDSPEHVLVKLLATIIAHPEDREKLVKSVVSPRAWNDRHKSSVAEVIEKWDVSKTRPHETSAELLGDFAVAGFEAQTTGSDRLGHRVNVTVDYGTSMASFQAFVLKEGGRYLLRAFRDDVPELGAEAFHAAKSGELERAKQWLTWAHENWRPGQGDDPLRRGSFLVLWNDGKGDVLLAAAALAARSIHAAEVISTLERAISKSSTPEMTAALRVALAEAHQKLEHWKEMLAPSRTLLADYPDSDVARRFVLQSLWNLHQYDEHVATIRAAMAKGPAQARAWRRALADSYEGRGMLKEARAIEAQAIAEGEPSADLLNSHSWMSLFVKPTEADLAEALRAVQLEQQRNPGILHTLASLQADLGHFGEARKTLKAILALREAGEPALVDYYIIGRIAEGLGLTDAARKAYKMIPKPERPAPTATYHLAQQRLQRLPAEAVAGKS